MTATVRVYIKAFKGDLTYEDEFTEITSDVDVSGLGSIKQRLDNNKYNVGTFRFTDFKLTLNNDNGLYSEPGTLKSIFLAKRKDSIVKVTWGLGDVGPICGIAIAGEAILSEEVSVFYGLLNDTASSQAAGTSKISFSVQGIESIFSSTETNYSSLSVSDTLSVTLFNLLNQTRITDLLTVSQSNISCGIDQVPDTIASLEETTVKESLDELLEKSNSVLYVDVNTLTVFVTPRTADVTVAQTFYGQGSNSGSENIVSIRDITTGINKMFNFVKWDSTTLTAKDPTSIGIYGVRKKDISNEIFTNNTKRQNILDEYRDEFGDPKQELRLETILDFDTVDLFLLNRIAIDYPTVYYPVGDELPRYGITRYGQDRYPYGAWNLTIPVSRNYKILGRSINLRNNTIEFDLREI